MRPTKKTIYLTAFGALLLVPASFLGLEVITLLIYNTALLLVIAYDGLITKSHLRFKINRLPLDTMQRALPIQMLFEVENIGAYALDFKASEKLEAFAFEGDFSSFRGHVEPRQKLQVGYKLTAHKRGDFKLKEVLLYYQSCLGLLTLEREIFCEQKLSVHPNLQKLKDFSWQRLQNRKYLEAIKQLKLRSNGHDFESLRDYRAGDDYRTINWQATARAGVPVVNQFQMENNQRIYIMLDCGRTMSYTIKGSRMLDLAIETSIVVAHRVHESGDQFAFCAFDQKIQVNMPCGKGLSHRQQLVSKVYNLEATMSSAHYGEAYMKALEKERHRSIVLMMTDFDTEGDVDRFLSQIAYGLKHHVFIVLLMTRTEIANYAGQPYAHETLYEQSTAYKLIDERERIIKRLKRHGVFAVICEPEQLAEGAIQQYLMAKAKLLGM